MNIGHKQESKIMNSCNWGNAEYHVGFRQKMKSSLKNTSFLTANPQNGNYGLYLPPLYHMFSFNAIVIALFPSVVHDFVTILFFRNRLTIRLGDGL